MERRVAWSEQLGKPMHAVQLETNAYLLDLICHDLQIDQLAVGDPQTDELKPVD